MYPWKSHLHYKADAKVQKKEIRKLNNPNKENNSLLKYDRKYTPTKDLHKKLSGINQKRYDSSSISDSSRMLRLYISFMIASDQGENLLGMVLIGYTAEWKIIQE